MAVWSDANGRTGGASPSSFTQNVFGNNQSPDTFVEGLGSDNCATVGVPTPPNVLAGTCSSPSANVTLGFGSYQVTQTTANYGYQVSYSADCSGVIHPNQTKTCIINDLYPN